MKPNYLLPNSYKKIGWFLLIPALIVGLLALFGVFLFQDIKFLEVKVFSLYSSQIFGHKIKFGFIKNNISDEIISILIIIGGIFVAFSKEKHEDEFIAKIRMESLVWAIYVNYAILLLSIILIYDLEFLDVMIFNMFTILIFFIIRFYYILYKTNKTLSNEK